MLMLKGFDFCNLTEVSIGDMSYQAIKSIAEFSSIHNSVNTTYTLGKAVIEQLIYFSHGKCYIKEESKHLFSNMQKKYQIKGYPFS